MADTPSARLAFFKGAADFKKALGSIDEIGFLPTAKRITKAGRDRYVQMLDRKFDRKFDVRTEDFVDISDLTVTDGDARLAVRYEPTHVAAFPSLMSALPQDLSEFVFVDFGAGKGRVALLATNYNFKKIIGVEFAEELYVIMQSNISNYRNHKQRCFDVQALLLDGTKFEIPDENCVLFFYNPFKREALSKVAKNIETSYNRNKRKLFVVFYNPTAENGVRDIFNSIQCLREKRTPVSLRSLLLLPFDAAIYETNP